MRRRCRSTPGTAVLTAILAGALLLTPMRAWPVQGPRDSLGTDPAGMTDPGTIDPVRPIPDSLHPVRGGPTPFVSGSDTLARAGMEPGFFNSPTGALLRSVAFPGWGQWSNGKKTKAAICFAVETFLLSKAIIWRHHARESGIDYATFDFRRDRRNFYYWLTGFTVFISMFDAYGDRYLLYLERTRDAGDEYWGGRKDDRSALFDDATPAEWRLVLQIRF